METGYSKRKRRRRQRPVSRWGRYLTFRQMLQVARLRARLRRRRRGSNWVNKPRDPQWRRAAAAYIRSAVRYRVATARMIDTTSESAETGSKKTLMIGSGARLNAMPWHLLIPHSGEADAWPVGQEPKIFLYGWRVSFNIEWNPSSDPFEYVRIKPYLVRHKKYRTEVRSLTGSSPVTPGSAYWVCDRVHLVVPFKQYSFTAAAPAADVCPVHSLQVSDVMHWRGNRLVRRHPTSASEDLMADVDDRFEVTPLRRVEFNVNNRHRRVRWFINGPGWIKQKFASYTFHMDYNGHTAGRMLDSISPIGDDGSSMYLSYVQNDQVDAGTARRSNSYCFPGQEYFIIWQVETSEENSIVFASNVIVEAYYKYAESDLKQWSEKDHIDPDSKYADDAQGYIGEFGTATVT